MSLILKNITDREIDLLEANNIDWLPTNNYKKDKSIIFMNENEYNKAIKLLNGIKTSLVIVPTRTIFSECNAAHLPHF